MHLAQAGLAVRVDVVLVGQLREVDLGSLVAALKLADVDGQPARLGAHRAHGRDERLALAVRLLLRVVVVEVGRLRRGDLAAGLLGAAGASGL